MALTPWYVSMNVVTDKRFTYFTFAFHSFGTFSSGALLSLYRGPVTIRAHCAITSCEQRKKSPCLAEKPFAF